MPSLESLESVIQQQHDAVSRHTSFLNDLHCRCDSLQLNVAPCLHGLPVVLQLLQVLSLCPHALESESANRPSQALENGREARARAQRAAELAAARAAARREAGPPPPKLEEFIRLTQLLRCLQRCRFVHAAGARVCDTHALTLGALNATRLSPSVATTIEHAGETN